MDSFSSFTKRALQFVLLVSSMALCNGEVRASELGELLVHSRLGEYFYAEAQLIGSARDRSNAEECFRLSGSGETESGIPALIDARVSIERKNEERKLVISSAQPINDPVMRINVRVGCGAEITRSYTVLIDPAMQDPYPSQSGNMQPLKESKTSHLSVPTHTKPSSLKERKERMANRLAISDSHDVVASNSKPPLRISTELSIHLSKSTSENTRALLRQEYKLLSVFYILTEQQLVLDEQVRIFEAGLEETDVIAESRALSPSSPIPAASAKTPKPKNDESAHGQLAILIIIGLISTLILALLNSLKRQAHSPSRSEYNNKLRSERSLNSPDKNDPWTEECEALEQANAFNNEPETILDDAWIPPLGGNEHALHDPALRSDEIKETDDFTTAIELAEIMIVFGRVKDAISSLEEFLAQHPAAALAPWLRLLEIYRINGMRQEFENCSVKFRSHFGNVSANWDEAEESR